MLVEFEISDYEDEVYLESIEEDDEDEEELIYDAEDIDGMLEDDEITPEEEGFMNGYIRATEF